MPPHPHRRNTRLASATALFLLAACRTHLLDPADVPVADGLADAAVAFVPDASIAPIFPVLPENGLPWPSFGHDPFHRSRTPNLGPVGALKVRFQSAQFDGYVNGPVVGLGGELYVGGAAVRALRPSDGKVDWSFDAAGDQVQVSLAPDGTVYALRDSEGGVVALSPRTGDLLWRVGSLGNGADPPPTVGGDGTVYFVSGADQLTAVRGDGKVLFERGPDVPLPSVVTGLSARGELLQLDFQAPSALEAHAVTDGQLVWRVTTDFRDDLSNAVTTVDAPGEGSLLGGGNVYLIEGQSVVARDAGTGGVLWRYAVDDPRIPVAVTATVAGGDARSGSLRLADINALLTIGSDGKLLWKFPAPSRRYLGPPIVDGAGITYVIGYDPNGATLHAVDDHGTELTHLDLGGPHIFDQQPALSADGIIYAVDKIYLGNDSKSAVYAFGP